MSKAHGQYVCTKYFEEVLPDEDGNCSLCGSPISIGRYDRDEFVDTETIVIAWGVDDVKGIASDLTDSQCRRVLLLAKNEHDANEGVNWDVLERWATYVRENPLEVPVQ